MNNVERMSHYGILIIALCALFTSVWQAKITKQHNKLTVKPYLDFSIVQDNEEHKVSISNQGFGPAIIKKVKFRYNGKEYADLYDALKAANERKNVIGSFKYGKNSIVAPGTTKLLIHLKERRFRNIQVVILYESIYGEKEWFDFKF